MVDANWDVARVIKAFMFCNALEYARKIFHQLREGDVHVCPLRSAGVFSMSISAAFHRVLQINKG